MKDIMYVKIQDGYTEKYESGKRPMFSFAVDEYFAKYKDRIDPEKYCEQGRAVFGAVLERGELRGDRSDDFECIMNLILKNSVIDIVVFDVNAIDVTEALYLQQASFLQWTDDGDDEFVELPDVYEDRFVFVRVPKEQPSLGSGIAC